jgi:hypothetical protein
MAGTLRTARISCTSSGPQNGPDAATPQTLASVSFNVLGSSAGSALQLANMNVFNHTGSSELASCNPTVTVTTSCSAAVIAMQGGPDGDGDTVADGFDNCPTVYNPGQENSDNVLGNGRGSASADTTAPNGDALGDACDPDMDNDGLLNADDGPTIGNCGVFTGAAASMPDAGGGDITADDNNNANAALGWDNGTDAADDPASFDQDGDGQRDGAECNPQGGGTRTNPTDKTSKLAYNSATGCGLAGVTGGGADQDGVRDDWEFCRWGTSASSTDTDGDGVSDCVEIADNDGDKKVTAADINNMKKALFLATFGRDVTFDLDGDGKVTGADLNQLLKWNFEVGSGAGKCRQAFDRGVAP